MNWVDESLPKSTEGIEDSSMLIMALKRVLERNRVRATNRKQTANIS